MKFLLLVMAVLVLLWLLRGSLRRLRRPPPPAASPAPDEGPLPMLSCAQCGLHLPRDEALPGRGGVFCGAAHRSAYEQSHPET